MRTSDFHFPHFTTPHRRDADGGHQTHFKDSAGFLALVVLVVAFVGVALLAALTSYVYPPVDMSGAALMTMPPPV